MAAGLGFKTFTTGEVLTAADVNGYLMQGILVFANAAARTSAITSPQEGQYSFLKDTNALEYYDGAAWVGAPVGDITAVNAGTGISGGGASGSVTITNDMATTITAAGDIVVGTGNATYDNLPIGTTGQVLTADTTVSPYKVKWASASTSSGPTFSAYRNQSQTLTINAWTKVQFEVEDFDTDSCYDNTTNYRFTPNKSGYYQFNYNAQAESGYATNTALYKNGSIYHYGYKSNPGSSQNNQGNGAFIAYANGTTDYFEVYVNPGNGYPGTAVVNWGTDRRSAFSGIWIRS